MQGNFSNSFTNYVIFMLCLLISGYFTMLHGSFAVLYGRCQPFWCEKSVSRAVQPQQMYMYDTTVFKIGFAKLAILANRFLSICRKKADAFLKLQQQYWTVSLFLTWITIMSSY